MAEMAEPRGRAREFTDRELRNDLEAGLKPRQIAAKYRVSKQAVHQRIDRLELSTVAAAVAPEESRRHVRAKIDALEELTRGLSRVNLLMDACDAWLRDAEDPSRYDIGARAEEVTVTYAVLVEQDGRSKLEHRKATLQELLDQVGGAGEIQRSEFRHADPRTLILSTVQEVRQTVQTAADLARMLTDARIMQRFREAVMTEIAKESPEVATRIADAVGRGLVVGQLYRGPEALPDGGRAADPDPR